MNITIAARVESNSWNLISYMNSTDIKNTINL